MTIPLLLEIARRGRERRLPSARRKAVGFKYREDQPRDWRGRWVDVPSPDLTSLESWTIPADDRPYGERRERFEPPEVPRVREGHIRRVENPPDPGGDWTRGYWGKGFLDPNGEPVTWQVDFPGLSPHHDDIAEERKYWQSGVDPTHYIVITPDGRYSSLPNARFEARWASPQKEDFEAAFSWFENGDLKQVDTAETDAIFDAYWQAYTIYGTKAFKR